MKKVVLFFILYGCSFHVINAQVFSVATDITLLRNFSKYQHFYAIGQTVQVNLHFSPKESAYAWISYYTNGSYNNNGMAEAISLLTRPERLNYNVASTLNYKQLSLGWKHFFKGAFDAGDIWHVYGYAGFGLLFAGVTNTYNQVIDTSKYIALNYITPNTGNLTRLTFDLGLGVEYPLGSAVYLYGELRTWLPASDYPSSFLLNNNMPRMLAVNGGIRVLLD